MTRLNIEGMQANTFSRANAGAALKSVLPTLPRDLCGPSVLLRGHLGILRGVNVSPTRYVINHADASTRGTADPWLTPG